MKISELGERKILARLFPIFKSSHPDIIINVGDDAAAVRLKGDIAVLTTDMLIEAVHFRQQDIAPYTLGRKSLAVNLSDIAAVAGIPRFALLSLGLPPELELSWLTDFYRGLSDMAAEFGVALVGGDLTASSVLVINLMILGEPAGNHLAQRGGARPDDVILVTGSLGGSGMGIKLLLGQAVLSEAESHPFIDRHQSPIPRVREAQIAQPYASAIEDISDGLLTEISHICELSGTGARIKVAHVPLDPGLADACKTNGVDPALLAMTGGEDYELVISCRPSDALALKMKVEAATGTPVSEIGVMTGSAQEIILEMPDGEIRTAEKIGYEHFSAS